jgi:hypothetical protein
MTKTPQAPDDTVARPVTLMARVPATLAQEVQAYATTHQLPISALVRAGLTYVLTQPPPVEVPVRRPDAAPRPSRPPRVTFSSHVLEVLAQAPDGLSVADVFFQLPSKLQRKHGRGMEFIGSTLRALWRRGRIQRVSHGVYATLQPPNG